MSKISFPLFSITIKIYYTLTQHSPLNVWSEIVEKCSCCFCFLVSIAIWLFLNFFIFYFVQNRFPYSKMIVGTWQSTHDTFNLANKNIRFCQQCPPPQKKCPKWRKKLTQDWSLIFFQIWFTFTLYSCFWLLSKTLKVPFLA